MTNGKQPARGFTYLMLLWWVAISGVMLMAIASRWTMATQRQREAELVFRGEQISAALQAYYQAIPGARIYPQNLTDLLADQRGAKIKRHLRRMWSDPVTGMPWGLVKNDQAGIVGVYSLSERTPLAAPVGVKSYTDWRFMAGASVPEQWAVPR